VLETRKKCVVFKRDYPEGKWDNFLLNSFVSVLTKQVPELHFLISHILYHDIRNGCKLHDTLIFLLIQTPRQFNFAERYLCFLENTPAVLTYLIQVIYMHTYKMPNVSFYARYYIQAFKPGPAQKWLHTHWLAQQSKIDRTIFTLTKL
jgi:hypothetical protein